MTTSATTAPLSTDSPTGRSAAAYLALWLPVLSFVGVGFALIRADLAAYEGLPENLKDSLDGLTELFIGGVCVLAGLVSLVIAVVGMFLARNRVTLAVVSSAWVGLVGAGMTGLMAFGHTDERYNRSTTMVNALPWYAAAVVAFVVPLVVAILVQNSARRR